MGPKAWRGRRAHPSTFRISNSLVKYVLNHRKLFLGILVFIFKATLIAIAYT